MKRVLFIAASCGAVCLWLFFIGFSWMENRLAPVIATEEVTVMQEKFQSELVYLIDLDLKEEEVLEMIWCRHLDWE